MTTKPTREIDTELMALAKLVGSHAIGDNYSLLVVADEVRKLRQAIEARS
ncbi:MAG TPA: hypothetical protein VNG12_00110 [Acidimicrobiales bacterium]|nr:hypothetical protein [Acidimicrobiales bacterium]